MSQRNQQSSEDCDQADTERPVTSWLKSLLIGVAAAGVLALALVVWTGFLGGKSPAERAATSLAMPVGAFWLCLLAGAIVCYLRKLRASAMIVVLAWLTVSVLFNGRVAGRFLQSLEFPTQSDPASEIELTLDAVVLLGGYAADNRFDISELGGDGQRLMLAAQLWHAGKTKTVICTGTGAEGTRDPSEIGRQLLVSIGVPNEVIFGVPGVNTAAEMASLELFFQSPPDAWVKKIGQEPHSFPSPSWPSQSTVGLVTTSVHLSRAMRLAQSKELDFAPLGCCFQGARRSQFSPRELIPSVSAGKSFAIALKEWLAGLVGR